MTIQLQELRGYISELYSDVARFPRARFHFATGRPLMEHLGYPAEVLDRIPASSVECFAGVGYHFGLAPLREGEAVLDVGAGAGSDTFFAAACVGPQGRAVGVDMTDAMVAKAAEGIAAFEHDNVHFERGYAEELPFEDASFDCVTSNGVVNLTPDKDSVFAGIHRVLKPGGRLVLSDIVTGVELPPSIRESCELWAECIGGAELEQRYVQLIHASGLHVQDVRRNDYRFIQDSTAQAADKFKVHSISVFARKPGDGYGP
ncbi:MAG: methyltransferase domain-containing protein [Myxococcota bacterium]